MSTFNPTIVIIEQREREREREREPRWEMAPPIVKTDDRMAADYYMTFLEYSPNLPRLDFSRRGLPPSSLLCRNSYPPSHGITLSSRDNVFSRTSATGTRKSHRRRVSVEEGLER